MMWRDRGPLHKAAGEVVGSTLYYFGAGALAIEQHDTGGEVSLVGNALAHGMLLAMLIAALGHVSGAHFNPAVTFTLLITRHTDRRTALAYWCAQLLAAALAALTLRAFFPESAWGPVHAGASYLRPGVDAANGVFVEATLSALLVLAIFGTTLDPRHQSIAGFGVGLTVFADILIGGPRTGASMNPLHSLASALASGFWQNHWVYWVGPFVGAGLCGLTYMALFWPAGQPADKREEHASGAVPLPGVHATGVLLGDTHQDSECTWPVRSEERTGR